MKYINIKWIMYELKGWHLVLKNNFLLHLTNRLLKQEDRKILDSKIGTWYKKYYVNSIAQLNNFLIYGKETGLQNISDSCWWNKR